MEEGGHDSGVECAPSNSRGSHGRGDAQLGSCGSVSDLLARQARIYPTRIALTDGARVLSYRVLDGLASHVADRLRAGGVGRGERVVLAGARDARMFALLYGAFRAGAAAVLVSDGWDARELLRRLDAVTASRVVTTDPTVEIPGAVPVEFYDIDAVSATDLPDLPDLPDLADLPDQDADPGTAGELAYLSFTSGSAGRPKAVAVSHANALHYAFSLRERLGFMEADEPCMAHVTPLAADLGHTAWLLALATAGRVHVVSDALTREPQQFWRSLWEAGVSCVKTTPSHLMALLEARPTSQPRIPTLILGGESLSRSLAADLLGNDVAGRVVNHYGPTETTVGATCFIASDTTDMPAEEATVPIGTPIGAATVRILDPEGGEERGQRPGELLIGGAGVAVGYYNQPDTTARHFIDHQGDRMYRTGDVCRRRADGNLVFIGRSDRQVKIRGFRVDPSEIERAIDSHPDALQSAVIVRKAPAGDQLFAAVRVSGNRPPHHIVDPLRTYLRGLLPEHAVPAQIIAVRRFPVGPSGKLDTASLSAKVNEIIEQRARAPVAALGGTPRRDTADLAEDLAKLWSDALGISGLGTDVDVFTLGGDSILAMRTVAFLRRRGCDITVEDVYRNPTCTLLSQAARRSGETPLSPSPSSAGDRTLAPPQRWFFRQPIREPHRWNQTVVLLCRESVDPPALSEAIVAVLHKHPVLRQPIGAAGPIGDPRRAPDLNVLTFSFLPATPTEISAAVNEMGGALQDGLDLEAGRLVRGHLFIGGRGIDDRLVITVHHLAVDGVSWRIIFNDLAAAYAQARAGQTPRFTSSGDYYQWAKIVTPSRTADLSPRTVPRAGGHAPRPAALTWGLDEVATTVLTARCGQAHDLEAVLLAAFGDGLRTWSAQREVTVEVETHGRDEADYMDTVGWFTAVKRVRIDLVGADEAHDRTRDIERGVHQAPQLPMDTAGPRPNVGFNFLGTFRLPEEQSLRWTVATETAGAARCPSGDPLYDVRLTARIIHGKLVTDLVYDESKVAADRAEGIFTAFSHGVAARAGLAEVPPLVVSPISTSGAVLHLGTVAQQQPRLEAVHEPVPVLLTGATGYLGGHVLTELVSRGAHVTCLVRGERDEAMRRVEPLRGAVDIVVGDITEENLGLSQAEAATARDARVIVHAAADVRLVAPPAELERTNTEGVRRLLSWIDAGRADVRLHHVSTLAVAGHVDGSVRRFSQADLSIGQSFRNPYERTKYDAEELIRSWTAQGRQVYIHRSGHVAAHSRTGAFQHNIDNNRIYQIIHDYVQAGVAPHRPSVTFAFSHVDTVAAAMTAIALHPYAAPGVYHIETPHEVHHDELVRWLVDYGYPVRLVDESAFGATTGLAALWSQLERQNVVIERTRTASALERLGVRFAEPTRQWWSAALDWAVDVGFLPPPHGADSAQFSA
ncbi:AMP-binding protein [Streptomyces sp. NA02950]|uniref:AMP-binding protein n=1 Tax=Streptomyces sp. NA02950 TaxID=2742137 RepID=UPI00158FCC5B|nr:AMP-binding protein [Streptomyces sp. NA02950]QKV97349.1 AMP-binding protein [Streptomyces sp. NA02950]